MRKPIEPIAELNQDRVVFYQSQIRNMRVFTEPQNTLNQAPITDQPFAVEILKVHLHKIFVVSAERQISIYDQVTFRPTHGDKKIETSGPVTSLGFHGDKVYAGLKNATVEIFS